ncbi:M15 family metallopeptidase [[Mycobacterium] burgundiense]|uniref:M15 family metallopeptidase n=1 Tax=[Mycobacterium] burgundiense TaxID=3064286 RepID=A0ABM9LZI1_9MYCO|nr:M15 family metallopeptidase [Mycolicibacterium sp. MU0053]CAJ1507473.1 M15 family metallopeptidase [Mycolicibacterium sp. MU0053]
MRRAGAGLTLAAAAALAGALLAPLPAVPPRVALADNATPLVSPFDVWDPAVGRLEPALLRAVQDAANAAAAQGITMTVNSGWRSPQFQQRLLDDAVSTYGSYAAARQFVQTPEQSKHVVGAAVDIGGPDAAQWLGTHGARFGLCQIYANETWHFELAADADGVCPPLLPDAAG